MNLSNHKMNKEIIQIGSKIYEFPRMHYETNESYHIRQNFFIKVGPKTQKEYMNTLNMSIVLANIKILNCKYSPEVIENLNNLSQDSVKN